MKNKILFTFITMLSIILTNKVSCEASTNGFIPRWDCNSIHCWALDLSLYSGYITGHSKEKVYNQTSTGLSYKVSQLDWKIRNLWVLGGAAQINFLDDRLHVYVDGWGKIHASKSKMVDRDFFNINQPSVATDISWHPDTHLKTAFEIDVMLDYDFYCFQYSCQEIKFGVLIGYKYQKYHWNAYGGHFSYASGTINGNFPAGVLVIAYTQEFCIPYIGLQVDWNWNNWIDIRIFSKFTTLAYVRDYDLHALRATHFVGKFKESHFLVVGAEAVWNIYKYINLDLKYNYEHLNNTIGNATETVGDISFTTNDSVGIEHYHHLIALGLSASF